MGRSLGGDMYMPHAIDVDGHDHHDVRSDQPRVARGGRSDTSSIAAASRRATAAGSGSRRPVVMVGGELTLDMLDLTFNPLSKFYEAPIQLKANGGVFLVDDFGRQRMPPAGSAEPLDRAAREPRRLPHAAHRQEVPGAVRRADRVRDEPATRRRSPTKRSSAGFPTRFAIDDPTRRAVHEHLRAELQAARICASTR